MFNNCNTIQELTKARNEAVTNGLDITTVNNAFNKRRQEILEKPKVFVQLKPIYVKPREVDRYCGIPVAGRTKVANCIQLVDNGFLY